MAAEEISDEPLQSAAHLQIPTIDREAASAQQPWWDQMCKPLAFVPSR